jgi:hemerythrin-like domain-containing protein
LPPSSASGNQLTASLRQDHDIIKKVLKATSACIELLKEGKEIPPAILLDTVDFITNFIDRCDHAKEEQGLFAALEATGMPRQNSAIGTMLRGHEEARKIAERIKCTVNSYLAKNKSEQSRSALIQHCEECVSHLDRHYFERGYTAFHYCRKALERKRKCGKRYGRFCRDKTARDTG